MKQDRADAFRGDEASVAKREDDAARLAAFIDALEKEAERRVRERHTVENRWLEDLRQYHGVYDADVVEAFRETGGSTVFLNVTRPKTNALMARLWDLLFPTDDRNWGIRPTPVPDLMEQAEDQLTLAADADQTAQDADARLEEATQAQDQEAIDEAAGDKATAEQVRTAAEEAADELHEIMNEARRRADLMQTEIEDQLVTCNWPAAARDAIEDACKLGIGIVKGPVNGQRMRRRFQKDKATNTMVLVEEPDPMPAAMRIDPWSFYPDPNARKPHESEGFYERHSLNKKKLRELAKLPGINQDALREILKAEPVSGSQPYFLSELSDITGQKVSANDELYQVWEYTGTIDSQALELLAMALDDDAIAADMGDEFDPLEEIQGRVLFAEGRILSFDLHPLDSGEPIYSWFCPEYDEYSPYGFGIPRLIRDEQRTLNAAQRALLDNAALGAGPQILANKNAVQPANGRWQWEPRKIWEVQDTDLSRNGVPPFQVFTVPIISEELGGIIQLARQAVDEVTAMPQIAQGEQGTGVTKTAQGMALLMNSANVVFRRFIKNFDDDMTVPLIRRFYHWNMQFSDKDEIKGDYDVDARGSSVLLVREMQAQNLIMVAQMFGDHPIYGPMLKHDELLKQIFKAHMIPADEVTKTLREIEEDQKAAAKNPDPAALAEQAKAEAMQAEVEVKRERMDLDREIANMEADTRIGVAKINYRATLAKIAEAMNMKRDELDARVQQTSMALGDKSHAARIKAASDERKLAAEIAMAKRTGKSAGGSV